jgi:prepilin-type N-terminal cleavage/methylation domain-containing protein
MSKMSKWRAAGGRGFTLIEAMIAIVVLLIGLAGALAALISAREQVRQGALRQAEMRLVNSKVQRLLIANRAVAGILPAAAAVASPPEQVGFGTAPWVVDASAPLGNDLGTEAFFTIDGEGTLTNVTCVAAGTPAGCIDATTKNCASTGLPLGVYCRELRGGNDLPPQVAAPAQSNSSLKANLGASSAIASTLWIRVTRVGGRLQDAVTYREVLVQ